MKTIKFIWAMLFSIAVAACGGDGIGGWNIDISASRNTITAQVLTVGTEMTSFSPLTARDGRTPYSYSYTGTLPAGLSFSSSTGAVTGTPTATYATDYLVFSVKDANNVEALEPGRLGLTERFAVPFTVGTASALPAGYVVQGGLTWMPITFHDTWTNANAYCANTTINGQTGWRMPTQPELTDLYLSRAMSGQGWMLTRTWSSTAGYYYYIDLGNGDYGRANDTDRNYVSCVRNNAITATATTTAQALTVGTAMTSFSPLTPSDGTTPYSYSYTGTLPAGLSFSSSTGAVTGTPTATYATDSLVFSVRDANNVEASTTSTVPFTVVTASALPAGYVVQGGLIWMPITFHDTWTNANAYCANTTINGQTGWRMPTQPELTDLHVSRAMSGQGWWLNITWSSTVYNAEGHYDVSLHDGSVGWNLDTGSGYFSCVR